MAIDNSITFGGINSADFGIYISGEGVFNAPKRDAEMITIPGRNGAFVLDNGRFENITVTYPAFNFESDYDTFAQNLSDFRNAICAQVGYQRLTDTFHPDEYRMAAYVEGLEIKPIKYNTASQFDIVFDCKPQRWLTSGEEAISVDSGDTITNPTRFEAGPLLEVEGAGSISINGETVSVNGGVIGRVVAANAKDAQAYTASDIFSTQYANTGDEVTVGAGFTILLTWSEEGLSWFDYSVVGDGSGSIDQYSNHLCMFYVHIPEAITHYYGTPATNSVTVTFRAFAGNREVFFVVQLDLAYDGDDTFTATAQVTVPTECTIYNNSYTTSFGSVKINSSQSILGNPLYFDLDIGEAYKVEGGIPVSVNDGVTIPSELPKLKAGNNTITFDNTITDLKVVPRWWKV